MPTRQYSRSPRRARRWAALSVVAVVIGASVPAIALSAAHASTPNGGDVVANLFEWNWPSVAAECTNVLGPKGYGAVQVAPPQDSIRLNQSTHPWWEVYQPVGYDLNSRMGTSAQFAAMVSTCHAAGVKVYVDAVLNHTAGADQSSTDSYGGDAFSISGMSYSQPGYTPSDFHAYPGDCPNGNLAINDWNNQTQVQECDLSNLQDLRTESAHVRSVEAGYLNSLVGLGVDGFRFDAAKHINVNDLSAILGQVQNTTWTGSRPYVLQEVMPGGSGGLSSSTYDALGQTIGFGYATALKNQFTGNIADLQSFGQTWGFDPSASTGSMVANHDTERNGSTLSYKNGSTYVLANIFHLAWGYGTPQVYASFTWNASDDSPPADGNGFVTNTDCSNGWYCTDRVQGIANMVGWHNAASGQSVANWTSDGAGLIAFSRGSKAWLAINNGSSAQTRTYATGLPAGIYCDVIHGDLQSGSCTGPTVSVDASGNATVTVNAKDAVALYQTAGGTATATPTPSASASATPTPAPTSSATVLETFSVNATTAYGQNVYVVGSISALGSWDTTKAIPLSSAAYPVWSAAVTLPAGTAFEYKYIEKNSDGSVVWESIANRSASTGAAAATLSDTWNQTSTAPVHVTFAENETTVWGTNVYLVGSAAALGSWDTSKAIAMSSASYPTWTTTVDLAPGTSIEYKFITRDASGTVTWENGSNRTYTTGSSGSVTLSSTWK